MEFPHLAEIEMAPSKPFVSSEAQLFLDSLKLPAFMLFHILFSMKNTVHCTNIQMITSGYQFNNN